MPHFFLHGWCTWVDSKKNEQFFQTLCRYWKSVLIFPFWLDNEEVWYQEYKERFIKHNPDKQLFIACAHHNTEELIEQIKHSDILFFSWGKPYKQFEVINTIDSFKELVDNKIIAWVSWGAIMWAQVYYSSNAENLREGNGYIPIKIIAHRWSDKHPWKSWEEREKLLDEYGEKLPIVKLSEQEYAEFKI